MEELTGGMRSPGSDHLDYDTENVITDGMRRAGDSEWVVRRCKSLVPPPYVFFVAAS
jgi:hypothetical protein